jgi:hypothetical protein
VVLDRMIGCCGGIAWHALALPAVHHNYVSWVEVEEVEESTVELEVEADCFAVSGQCFRTVGLAVAVVVAAAPVPDRGQAPLFQKDMAEKHCCRPGGEEEEEEVLRVPDRSS